MNLITRTAELTRQTKASRVHRVPILGVIGDNIEQWPALIAPPVSDAGRAILRRDTKRTLKKKAR